MVELVITRGGEVMGIAIVTCGHCGIVNRYSLGRNLGSYQTAPWTDKDGYLLTCRECGYTGEQADFPDLPTDLFEDFDLLVIELELLLSKHLIESEVTSDGKL